MIFYNNNNNNDFENKTIVTTTPVIDHLEAFRARNRQIIIEIRRLQKYMEKHELLEESISILKDKIDNLKLLKSDIDREIKQIKANTARNKTDRTKETASRLAGNSNSVLEQGRELLRSYKELNKTNEK